VSIASAAAADDAGGDASRFAAPPADGRVYEAFALPAALDEGAERAFARGVWCAVAALAARGDGLVDGLAVALRFGDALVDLLALRLGLLVALFDADGLPLVVALREHDALAWVDAAGLDGFAWAPADVPLLGAVAEHLDGPG
jgi:hypothetical protein